MKYSNYINKIIIKLVCIFGHDYEYIAHGILGGRGNAFYGERCKNCGHENVTFFGHAYRKKDWWR